jgi:DNA-binding sugar fermentation-stimulating protein
MNFTEPLIPATLVKRYKRFLADVVLRQVKQSPRTSPTPAR